MLKEFVKNENEQVSASDSVEVLEETNGNMDNSDVESDVTIISTGTTVLLWDEKSEDEQWNHSHNSDEEQGKQANKNICQKNEMESERNRANENGDRYEHTVKAQESSEEEVPVDTGVDEDGVEKKDCQEEVEQDILLFGETLLKHLKRRIKKGKQQLKWKGKVQEPKEFVTLVLKASGSWSTKKYAGKVNQHIFQEKKKSYTINFWPSKKTLIVQGNEKIAERIDNKIDKMLELMSKGSEEIESLIDEILDDRPLENTTTIRKSKSDKQVEKAATKWQIDQLWKAIKDLKDLLQKTSCQIIAEKECIEIKSGETIDIKQTNKQEQRDKQPSETKEKKEPKITDYFAPTKDFKAFETTKREYVTKIVKLNKENQELKQRLQKLVNENTDQRKKLQKGVSKDNEATSNLKQKQQGETAIKKHMIKRTTAHTTAAVEKVSSDNKAKESKPLILIAGDSIIKDVNGWMLSRTSRVKVHSFSGADISDMHDFLKPLIKKKPSRIIVHCGTNDLASNQVEIIAMNIKNLANTIKSNGIDCTVSGLTLRDDGLASKASQVNSKLEVF